MKKLMSVLLCLTMILLMLAGCGKTTSDAGNSDGSKPNAGSAADDAPDAAGKSEAKRS